jgi:hypothetical protein
MPHIKFGMNIHSPGHTGTRMIFTRALGFYPEIQLWINILNLKMTMLEVYNAFLGETMRNL